MTVLLTLLNMIPGVSSLIATITGKWFDSKVAMYQSRMGTTRDIAVAAITAEAQNNQAKVGWLNAVANSRFLQFIVGGFAFPWIIYGNKVIVWDNIFHKFFWNEYGYTPPIGGLVGSWAEIILGGIFVTSTGMGVTAAWLNRTKQ